MNKRAGMCSLVLAALPGRANLVAIAAALDMSETQAGNVLRSLVAEGVLSRDGLDVFQAHAGRCDVIAQSEPEFYVKTVIRPPSATVTPIAGRPGASALTPDAPVAIGRPEPATLDHPGRPLDRSSTDERALPSSSLPVTPTDTQAPARSDHAPLSAQTAQSPPPGAATPPLVAAPDVRDSPLPRKPRACADCELPEPGPARSGVPLPPSKTGRKASVDHWGFAELVTVGMSRLVAVTAGPGPSATDLQAKITNDGRSYARRHPGFALSVRILNGGAQVGYWRVDRSAREPYGPRLPKTAGNGVHP